MAKGMPPYDFEESVGYWVVTTARALQRALNEELAPHGITFPQWQVIGWLAAEGECCQAELAQRVGVEPPTLKGLLDRMQRRGWIERVACPGDARRKIIRLTPAVRPIWKRISEGALRVRARASNGLGPTRLHALRGTLARLRTNLGYEETPR